MASAKLSTEAILEETARIEEEIRQVQLQLNDTKTLNDDLVKSIERKEVELSSKEESLFHLREKNAAELEQIETVRRDHD